MPVYRIDLPGNELPRAVEADTPAQAVQYVVRDSVTVRRLDVSEAFALAVEGVALERAGETTPAAEPDAAGLTMVDDGSRGGPMTDDGTSQVEPPEDEETEGESEFAEIEELDPDRLRDDQQERERLAAEEPPFDAGDEELEGD